VVPGPVRRLLEEGSGRQDRSGAGRRPRRTEAERSEIIALVRTPPPGKLVRQGDNLDARDPERQAHWTLDALTAAARRRGIEVVPEIWTGWHQPLGLTTPDENAYAGSRRPSERVDS
jgi:transposase